MSDGTTVIVPNIDSVAARDGDHDAPTGSPAPTQTPPGQPAERWYESMAGVMVAAAGLLVLLGIVVVAMLEMPSGPNKGTEIVALATAAFGVIGAVVGAYFGVRAANRAVKRMSQTTTASARRG